jgi:thioredoxin 1
MNHLMFHTTDADFEAQVLESSQPVLIEFTADWCPPCKMLAPIIDEIARRYEGKLRVGLLDNDHNPAVIRAYQVMGLPTLILFVDGQPVERITGYVPRERIEAKVVRHLAMESA